jgi:putative RecB family exonuclease
MAPSFPTSLSPSRASDFTTCPLLFRFRSIDRLPEEPSAAAVRGTLVHRVLELLFDLPAGDRTLAAATLLADTAFAELRDEEPTAAAVVEPEPGADLGLTPFLERYFTMEDPRRLEPHARELGVSATIEDSFELRGIIDRVDAAPDGSVRIVDYKTGRAPSAAFEGKAMFQMRFYALAWWRMTGVVPRRLQLMYLSDGQTLRLEPDEDDLVATERRILALRDAISQAAQAENFAPKPSKLCDWCSHRSLCPAWEGTPPPFPGLPDA